MTILPLTNKYVIIISKLKVRNKYKALNLESTDNQFPHRISLSQAAALSGYHQDYLGQLCRLGKIKASKIGRNWYTTQSELQSLLNFTGAIEEEDNSFNGQVADEEDKGLFDFSAPEEETTPNIDGVRAAVISNPALDEEMASVESAEIQGQAKVEPIIATPVVIDNYVISEVDGIPIRLAAENAARQHHTIQSLVTRLKLDSLRSEVLQVSEVVQTMSDELAAVKEIVAKHDQVLRHRKDLATTYAASIDMFPQRAQQEAMLLSLEDDSTPEPVSVWRIWVAPALAILLVTVVTGWIVISNFPSGHSTVSTIKYQPLPSQQSGVVAGDNTDGLQDIQGASINIEP